jgi:digeranylgeranylglycerophospholipid reductase
MIKKEYDIIVVGAGPAGSVAAQFAARQGVSVLVLEKDRDVGYPVRCAEAINRRTLLEFIEPDDRWINATITKFAFIAPNGVEAVVDFKSIQGYVLERRIFDYELAKQASADGAEVITRAYVNDLLFDENGTVSGVKVEYRGEQIEIKSKIVIGADGVESRVGRWAGLDTTVDFRDMEACFQVTAANVPVAQDTLYFYFGKKVSPGGYFWVFPKGENIANVGLGVSGMECKKRSSLSYLNENINRLYPNASILTQIAGGVPCAVTLEKFIKDGIMLVGDAARQVNPLSGGGIASGMVGGSIAGRIAGEAVKNNNMQHIYKYKEEWYEARGKMHERFDKFKDVIYEFSDEDFNKIMEKLRALPEEKRTINKLFMIALANKPALLLDVAKYFIV